MKLKFRILDEESVVAPVKSTGKSAAEEKADSDVDEIARLKDALARAESEIGQLKLETTMGKGPGDGHELHARPLGPNMMPGPVSHFYLPLMSNYLY